ncbi:hypothetical protein CIN01S_09_04250 [Chryseobacterium indologenes NBRC 14944]|nr:hypothetical protein CIN01S_09_04250 [Chryseobacterium indologenes NBRC 14944]
MYNEYEILPNRYIALVSKNVFTKFCPPSYKFLMIKADNKGIKNNPRSVYKSNTDNIMAI